MPQKYVEEVIAEAKVKHNNRVSYEEFLDMWRQELEDRKMNQWRGISKQRTVSDLIEEMFANNTNYEVASDISDDDYEPISNRLVSIAEIEEQKSRSFSNHGS